MGDLSDLGELNHLLLAISASAGRPGSASATRARKIFESRVFKRNVAGFERAVEAAQDFGLIAQTGSSLTLTEFGILFLGSNPAGRFELTSRQRELLIRYALLTRAPIAWGLQPLIAKMRYDPNLKRYILEPAARPAGREFVLRTLLLRLGLVEGGPGGELRSAPRYNEIISKKVRYLRGLAESGHQPTDKEIELARHAESLAAQMERRRLREAGRADLAREVEVVSDFDFTTGYDVRSYAGKDSVRGVPDRFIEIKSTGGERIRFFLSRNEMRVARELGNAYAIMVFTNHSEKRTVVDSSVDEINNPARALLDASRFLLDAEQFEVTEKRGSA